MLFKVFLPFVSAPISLSHSAELSHRAVYTLSGACTEGRHTHTHNCTHTCLSVCGWYYELADVFNALQLQLEILPTLRPEKQQKTNKQTVRVLTEHQLHSSNLTLLQTGHVSTNRLFAALTVNGEFLRLSRQTMCSGASRINIAELENDGVVGGSVRVCVCVGLTKRETNKNSKSIRSIQPI